MISIAFYYSETHPRRYRDILILIRPIETGGSLSTKLRTGSRQGLGFSGAEGAPCAGAASAFGQGKGNFGAALALVLWTGRFSQSLPENSEFAPENRLEYYPFWGQSPIFSGWKCWVFRELLLLDFPFFLWIILGFFEEILLTDMTFANAPGGRRSRHASSPRWRLGRSLNR